jgi:hypothetical protein
MSVSLHSFAFSMLAVSRTQKTTHRNRGHALQGRRYIMLLRSFDVARLNAATALVLPFQAAFYAPAFSTLSVSLKVKNILVSDVFQYDARLNFLHWKDTRDPSLLQWKGTPQTVFRGLASGKFKFQQYFVPLCNPASLIDQAISFQPFVN